MEQLREYITSLAANVHIDKHGELVGFQLDLSRVPQEAHRSFGVMVETFELLHCVAVRLPEREVIPGESWDSERAVKLNLEDGRGTSGMVRLRQKYLGIRKRGNEDEAVFAIAGPIQGREHTALHGYIGGLAVIDVASGRIQEADARIVVNAILNPQSGGTKTSGTLILRLSRRPIVKS
jgi:hypothetical protein